MKYNPVIGIVMDIHASNLCVRCNTDTTKLSEALVQSQSTRQHTCTSNKYLSRTIEIIGHSEYFA
jgi:hypothetical protein